MKKQSNFPPLTCTNCQAFLPELEDTLHFCPFCGREQNLDLQTDLPETKKQDFPDILFAAGTYRATKLLGKGGMGEVFLAEDLHCSRTVALKTIQKKLKNKKALLHRFLREARITAQLAHPSIIPIYAIHTTGKSLFYTMPYVQGNSLIELLHQARQREKKGLPQETNLSIHHLTGILLKVAQAIAFAHNKGVLHRDIKPENIIVGQYGEVVILDWGLAKIEKSAELAKDETNTDPELTQVGKLIGTPHYIAPERALGEPATKKSDLFSLGVILYQILTLRYPFARPPLNQLKKAVKREVWQEPTEVAPHREIPEILVLAAKKALAANPKDRYDTVEEFIYDLQSYLEGHPTWLPIATIDLKDDWIWQEKQPVFVKRSFAEALHKEHDLHYQGQIAKLSFQGNIRIDTTVTLQDNSSGVGILLCVPDQKECKEVYQGLCIWISAEPSTLQIFRDGVEVLSTKDLLLQKNTPYSIRIERVENTVSVQVNHTEQLHYVSQIPFAGSLIGLLFSDAQFTIHPLEISLGSESLHVSCLAVPDAFLARGQYETALLEYRRLAEAFADHTEGREARFRSGITIMTQALHTQGKRKKRKLYLQALNEMNTLLGTPGAPLAYLGKALIYQNMGKEEDEAKSYELACLRYPNHPLMHLVFEHLTFRLHQKVTDQRKTTYTLSLLALQHIQGFFTASANKAFIQTIQDSLPASVFPMFNCTSSTSLIITLHFWLGRTWALHQILVKKIIDDPFILMAAYALLYLGKRSIVREIIEETPLFPSLTLATKMHKKNIEKTLQKSQALAPFEKEMLTCWGLFYSIEKQKVSDALKGLQHPLPSHPVFSYLYVVALLWDQQWKKAKDYLRKNNHVSEKEFLLCCMLIHENKIQQAKELIPSLHPLNQRAIQEGIAPDSEQTQPQWVAPFEKKLFLQKLSLVNFCIQR